jgi:hypothetical protein
MYFYILIDYTYPGNQTFDYCLLPLSFRLQIDRLKTGKIAALGNHLFDEN